MKIAFTVIGLVLGLFLGSGAALLFAAAAGAALGWIVAALLDLERRLHALEQRREPPVPAELRAPAAPTPPAAPQPRVSTAAPAPPAPATAASVARPTPPPPPSPGAIDQALDATRRWLTTGNVPVKLGVIISFFGVAFLLKYAVDRELLRIPIEARLLGVAAAAIALLVVGWRLRERTRVYALSLQGGGVGILYLTIFAALRLFAVIATGPAFVLLVALTLATGTLAVLQNARALATLGVVGGFLAPVLVSTGTGSHVVLFSYYLLLNAAILGVAWFRAWRELNWLGFVFTFVIGGFWGYLNYERSMLASTEPFVILYFLFYQLTAILFALRQPPDLRGLVDGTLIFGTPVLAFAMQAVLLGHTEFGLAISAVTVALFYAAVAMLLNRRGDPGLRLLIESFLALGVAFGTIAIPLALDARWTAAAWALEGAALVWVGTRQQRLLARVAGSVLVIGAGMAFLNHGWRYGRGLPFLNGNLLGGWLIALAALFSARELGKSIGRWDAVQRVVSLVLFLWGLIWWLVTGGLEIDERVTARFEPAAFVLFFVLSPALLTAASQRLDWSTGRRASFLSLPLLLLPAATVALGSGHPLGDLGFVAWPVAGVVQYWMLRQNEQAHPRLGRMGHAWTLALIAVLALWEVAWQLDEQGLNAAWAGSAASLVPGALLIVVLRGCRGSGWPLAAQAQTYIVSGCGLLLLLEWLCVAGLNLGTDGDPTPLPYLPLANPVDIASAFALLNSWQWLLALRTDAATLAAAGLRRAQTALGVVAFAISTIALLRAVHHLGGVPWQVQTLFDSVLVQAALSVYWGLLAFAGMIAGARGSRRWLWLAGAVLMGAVVLKLFVIDLGNTGTVARIVSFIATGALLLVVGYFAPVPPRQTESQHA